MKRFIKEYANFQKETIKNLELMNETLKENAISKIDKTLVLQEKGFLTVDEAIKNILEAHSK